MTETRIAGQGCDDDDDDERGKRGHRGHRGHQGETGATGPTGPTGPTDSGPSGLLKFSGEIAPTVEGLPGVSYLADWGVGIGVTAVLTFPTSYPVAAALELRNLSTNIFRFVVPPDDSILFELLLNGVAVPGFAITYNPGDTGVKVVFTGPVAVAIGDTLDLQVTNSGDVTDILDASATIGTEPA